MAATDPRHRLGRRAEQIAAQRLEALGWELIERNVRFRRGELDIVARDDTTLVFVEVKAARSKPASRQLGPERAVLAVDGRKQSRLRALAAEWLSTRGCPAGISDFRFDAIGVEFDGWNEAEASAIEHLRAAF